MFLFFPVRFLSSLEFFKVLAPMLNRYLPVILEKKNNSFHATRQAETDPSFKQIIPYVVITDGKSILHYVRGKKAGEQRLVAKGSIGIGGHINDEDHTLFASSAYRLFKTRLSEKSARNFPFKVNLMLAPSALINDDSTEVGRVHFGVVHVLFCTRTR
jgi:predicted NUDIX family phosphoesterase